MLIQQKIGNITSFDIANRSIDTVYIEWFETAKRILHKRTTSGTTENDWRKVELLDDECTAVKLPRETRQASQKLGIRLIKLFELVCESQLTHKYKAAISQQRLAGHYSIAFGLYAHALHIFLSDSSHYCSIPSYSGGT